MRVFFKVEGVPWPTTAMATSTTNPSVLTNMALATPDTFTCTSGGRILDSSAIANLLGLVIMSNERSR
jgi:hypothetical protein